MWYFYIKIWVFCQPNIVSWSCTKSADSNHQGNSMHRLLGLCFDTTAFVCVDHSENPLMIYFSSQRVVLPRSDRIWGLEEVFQVFVAWWPSACLAGWGCIQVQSHTSATRTVNLWLLLTLVLSHTSHPSIITLYSCVPANQRTAGHSRGDTAIIPVTWPLYHFTHSREGKDAGTPWERLSKGDRKCCWWSHWLQHTMTPAAWKWEVKDFAGGCFLHHPVSRQVS